MRSVAGCLLVAAVVSTCGETSPGTTPGVVTTTAALAQLTLDTTSLMGGSSAQGTVTLTTGAPATGVVVSLSSNSSSASVPGTVAVAAGATSATFTVATQAVQATTDVTIVASLGNANRPITLTLQPAPPPKLIAFEVPSEVVQFEPVSGRVVLDRAAGSSGVVVSLSSDDTAATLPASVTVPEGATSATINIATRAVSYPGVRVILTASYGGDRIGAPMLIRQQAPVLDPYVSITTSPGDPLGQGRSGGFTHSTAGFSAVNSCQGGAIKLQVVARDGRRLVVIMTGARGQTLGPNTYTGAQLYPNQATDRPGLFAEWEGRTCSQIFRGQFTIMDLLLGDGGTIKKLHATLAFSCNSASAPEFSVWINHLTDLPLSNDPARCP
jgi:hypothetical protein